jgi:hypothetical protein
VSSLILLIILFSYLAEILLNSLFLESIIVGLLMFERVLLYCFSIFIVFLCWDLCISGQVLGWRF